MTLTVFVAGPIALACCAAVAASLGACSGTGKVAPGSIGVSGGTITSNDGLATLVIPSGALQEATEVTLTVARSDPRWPLPALGRGYSIAPAGLQLTGQAILTLPIEPLSSAAEAPLIMTFSSDAQYTTTPATLIDAMHVSAPITVFETEVPVFAVGIDAGGSGGGTVGGTGGASSGGSSGSSTCMIACNLNEVFDGGIGCDCSTTCAGVVYDVECICGACMCFQNGVITGTTTTTVQACEQGTGPSQAYFACGYPASKNSGSTTGPTHPPPNTCP